jgi:hypothetical protein
MSTTSQTISIIRDPLAQAIKGALDGLVDGNIDGIANEVAQSDDGNLTVSFSVKLTLNGLRVAGVGKIGYSRKFTDESEFLTPDPNQPPLPFEGNATVTIKAGDASATITSEGFKRLAKAAARSGDKARSQVEEGGGL